MPLLKYFGFVGSALALLLIGIGWCFPQPVTDEMAGSAGRPVIRISSVENPPERVVIDTSLPTIAAPPNENFEHSSPEIVAAQERLQGAFAEIDANRNQATQKTGAEVFTNAKSIAKREAAKKVVIHRSTRPRKIASSPTYRVQDTTPSTRMSLLEALKERLEQTISKLN